jgi:hypothetical protein
MYYASNIFFVELPIKLYFSKKNCDSNKHLYYVTQVEFYENECKSTIDAPPSSLMDSTASPKMKTSERKGVRACSLAHSIWG